MVTTDFGLGIPCLMGELKSAWEVAQERANRLGKLSAGEKERQERQQYRQVGEALAQKWLDSSQHVDIFAELSKYEEKVRDVIRKAVLERLVKAIELADGQDTSTPKRVLEAIGNLNPELRPKAEEIGQLVQEYELAEQKIRQELESGCREALHRLRISGTAVGAINIEANPKWQPARQKLIESFGPGLNALKQGLTDTA